MNNETFFNILAGIIMGSYLDSQMKTKLLEKLREIENKVDDSHE